MRTFRTGVCVFLLLALVGLSAFGQGDNAKAETVRTGLRIVGAGMGMVGGSAFSVRISLQLLEAPMFDAVALALPVAAVGAATGALAGRWIGDVVLSSRPSPWFAMLEGAGLGLLSGLFVGASTVSTCAVLSLPRFLDRIERLEDAQAASTPDVSSASDVLGYASLAAFLGGGRGAGVGLISGVCLVPLISLYMGF